VEDVTQGARELLAGLDMPLVALTSLEPTR
jgi:hypothetical protein